MALSLVSDVITYGMQLADVPSTSFYSSAEQLASVQLAWKQMYSFLCEQDDDYFLTSTYFTNASFTADTNRQNVYIYTLPADFYRLRLLQCQGYITGVYVPVQKATLENFGITTNAPAYRFYGTSQATGAQLIIYDPTTSPSWNIWYYPAPLTLTTSSQITYPNSQMLEWLAYQVCIDIRKKQMLDATIWEQRKAQIMESIKDQVRRDDYKPEQIKNTFGYSYNPWY